MIENDFVSNFEIPKNGFKIVQHTRDMAARKFNSLYLPCRRLSFSEFQTKDFQLFLCSMREKMNSASGIGLAANQIDKRLQVFMIEAKSDNPRYSVLGAVPFQVFINPKIVCASSSLYNFWHGCLSADGEKRGNVATYEWIEYECLDENGMLKKGKLTGLASVIFQHEFRHMLGGTCLDRASIYLTKEDLDLAIQRKEQNFFEKITDLPHLISDYNVGDTLEEYYSLHRQECQ